MSKLDASGNLETIEKKLRVNWLANKTINWDRGGDYVKHDELCKINGTSTSFLCFYA